MAGLKFYTGLGVGSAPEAGNTAPAPASASEMAFGPSTGAGTPRSGGLMAALSPGHPAGLSFWLDIAACGLLVWLWCSLPA